MTENKPGTGSKTTPQGPKDRAAKPIKTEKSREIGGPKGLEPTRYGDWERKGIVTDF